MFRVRLPRRRIRTPCNAVENDRSVAMSKRLRSSGPIALVAFWSAALNGTKAPFINEYVYLVRLRAFAKPDYLPRDWSLRGSFGESLLFNTVFAPIARRVSIVDLAWIGRGAVWIALAGLLITLGRRLGISSLGSALAVCAWMPWQLHLSGADWMFGTFESKPIAYCCIVGALVCTIDQRASAAMLLAGLALSVHPGVGAMAAPGLVLALGVAMRERLAWRALAVRLLWFPAGAVIGIYGILRDFHGSSGSRALWHWMALDIYPFHLNPWHFGVLGVVVMFVMLAFIVTTARADEKLRVLATFLLGAAGPYALGILAFQLGWYEWLRFFPFRVFPVLVTIAFALVVARQVEQLLRSGSVRVGRKLWVPLLVVAYAFVGDNGIRNAAFSLRRVVREYQQPRSDLQLAYDWIRTSTPRDAVIIAPPGIDPHYDTQRSQIATFGVPRWDAVVEWQQRILAQLASSNEVALTALQHRTTVDALYRSLTLERVRSLHDRYGATFLVSQQVYALTERRRIGAWHVYEIG